ncbi:MAG: hypothetical protein IJ343_13980 [Clostridia bacterium]|nr:hypothetical protein [Clostridia bacterium]
MYGAVYLAAYLMGGLLIIRFLLPRHAPLTRVWLGLSLGLLLMMWLPALLAFAESFTVKAHLLALIPLCVVTAGAGLLRDRSPAKGWDKDETRLLTHMLMVVVPLTLLSGWLQYTHCVRIAEDGSWWGGQSTYGDLAMHMSFVTSLKNAAFPPEYALFPGQQLSYPFLMDSLSTSFYLLGWPLQLSLTIPGTFMMALCYMGVMCLAGRMTTGKRTVILAALLFFLNGGLGFIYDFDLAGGTQNVWNGEGWTEAPTVWARIRNILDGYYMTPTNQPTPHNLRWSNVIADMMVPQRTLLGGWCMVIPCLYLLWTGFGYGRIEGPRARQTALLGVWGGALPLIHTHSFTALALCSAGFLAYDFFHTSETTVIRRSARPGWMRVSLTIPFVGALGAMVGCVAAHVLWKDLLPRWTLLTVLSGATAAVLATGLADLVLRRPCLRREFGWYILYGAIACVLSVPQLFGFTFNQVFQEGMQQAQNSFIKPWFNWVNSSDGTFGNMIDGYGWFYLKNIGLPFLILIFALVEKNAWWRRIFCGALPIILAGECIRFQPNIYDNNKLLYLAWLLCAMIVADWCGKLWHWLRGMRARTVIAVLAAATFFLSAGLTLWREAVSNYQLFSAGAVEVGEYVRDYTDEDATFLTGANHHLNPIASIGGRKIVCGPDLWLYYHGLNTAERKAEISAFYRDPAGQQQVLEKYGVDYIAVTSYERNDYTISYDALDSLYPRIFENGEAVIWRTGLEDAGE